MRALSIRQPWLDAILFGGKRIENRIAWKGSAFRGPVYLHAAKAMTIAEYGEAWRWMRDRGIKWQPQDPDRLVRGALVGRCEVLDVILSGGLRDKNGRFGYARGDTDRHPFADDPWYMGGFALVLGNVEVFEEPIPYKGMLGFFNVDPSVAA